MTFRWDGFKYVNLGCVRSIVARQNSGDCSWRSWAMNAASDCDESCLGPSFGTHGECLQWITTFLGGAIDKPGDDIAFVDYEIWKHRALNAEAALKRQLALVDTMLPKVTVINSNPACQQSGMLKPLASQGSKTP